MTLESLPKVILEAHTRFVDAQKSVSTTTLKLKNLTTTFEANAGTNSALSNQVQRKAYVVNELATSSKAVTLRTELNTAQAELQRAELYLEYLRNEFAVAKLTFRRETAVLENSVLV